MSVLAGVGLAIAASLLVGLTWWSLASIVLVSILIGQALRLGPHLLEVPISAMLILAAGGAGVNALDRVVETLDRRGGRAAGQHRRRRSVHASAARAWPSNGSPTPSRACSTGSRPRCTTGRSSPTRPARGWTRRATLGKRVEFIERELDEASESRRLNPRAVGMPDTTPDLRTGLQALEHAAIALRAVFRSLAEGPDVTDDEARPEDRPTTTCARRSRC